MLSMILSITMPDQTTIELSYEQLLSKSPMTVLYFYPKDHTSGCTKQARDFANMADQFGQLWVQIVWVSKDTPSSHCSFIQKQWLSFALISDKQWQLHTVFDTVGEKSMYGKKYQWTIRSTFLLDQKGTILHERRNVSVSDHVEKVLAVVHQIVS